MRSWAKLKKRRFNLDLSIALDSWHLTKNLVKGGHHLSGFEDYSKAQYVLLIRKRVQPYEYMTSWDKFNETSLPPEEAFYSKLNMSDISDKDYPHAHKVWKGFGMKNLGEYHNLYLKTDTILLTNMSGAFSSTCLEHQSLDPAHFYTSPGLSLASLSEEDRH